MSDALATAAARPFGILESMKIPCGYERSFKFQQGQLLANRYLLGFDIHAPDASQWQQIFQQLQMPSALIDQFEANRAGANLALLGFEAQSDGNAVFKLYLEYWDQLQKRQRRNPADKSPHPLHLGFKWSLNHPQNYLTSQYLCLPGLDLEEIRSRMAGHYANPDHSAGLQQSLKILSLAARQSAASNFIYVDVSEAGNARHSFDLNLYAAELRLRDIAEPITRLAHSMEIDPRQLQQLLSIIKDQPLGHLSAGRGRDGNEYFTLYYEN